ncbi:2Fe-2S iron-sulfur cluster-binding protein [Streptomyces sp. AHA2]|uniref:2Fe-2S iron-sulfur cluster-binding protein n=1 Tax=Streptomyces sp. AHA2 TaxID=3064526 RepID=UPI002FE2F3B2
MTDDQHGEGTPRSGSRWDPLPQGEYDDGATAFVELPEGGVDALLAADSPLAAPGHGYVPPQITVTPATTAGTDPAATGSWPVPGAPVDGAQWHEPHPGHGPQHGHDVPEPPYGPDPSYGSQAPYGSGTPYGAAAPYGTGAGQHDAGPHGGDDRFTYEPGSSGQWTYEEPGADRPAPGHDVTGQWSIPVAGGDLPDESGEFTTSSLVEQWGGTPPATLPGGAPAPWATQAAGEPWGRQAPAGQEHPGPDHGPAEHGTAQGYAPEQRQDGPSPEGTGPHGDHASEGHSIPGGDHAGASADHPDLPGEHADPPGSPSPPGDHAGSSDGHPAPHADHTGSFAEHSVSHGQHPAAPADQATPHEDHAPPRGRHAGTRGGHAGPHQDPATPHETHAAPDRDPAAPQDAPAASHGGHTAAPALHESDPDASHGTRIPGDEPRTDPHGRFAYAPEHTPQTPGAGHTDGTGHAPDEPAAAEAPVPGHGQQSSDPDGHGTDAATRGLPGRHGHGPDGVPSEAGPEATTPGPEQPGHAPEPSDGPGHAPDAGDPAGTEPGAARPHPGTEAPQDSEEPQAAQEAAEPAPGTGEPAAHAEDASQAREGADGTAEPAAGPSPEADGEPESAERGIPDGPAPDGAPAPAGAREPGAPGESATTVPQEEHPLASYVLRVNGADRPVTEAWIGESLLYVLRERLGLAGAKDGCSQGECGACNVQVDGRLVASCLVPAVTAAGSEVRTVEGLAEDGQPSDVQRALARCGAVQCGFCIPGMAMTVHDLLAGNPAPTELETRQALCGNLCRCSGYRGVVEAVKEVVAEREALAAPTDADGDEARIPHQAGPGAGGVHASAFGAPPEPPAAGPHSPEPHDQPYGQDGGPA